MEFETPDKIIEAFKKPLGSARFRVLYGGRGSGKSFNVAKIAAVYGAVEKLTILATREIQQSIKDSFMAEIKKAIESDKWLQSQYEVGRDFVRAKNGTEFIFRGLRHNIDAIKSLAQIDICIVEEAETVPAESWLQLLPTIRANNSEIWIIFNPKRRDSWVAQKFLLNPPPPRSIIQKLNFSDNPFFPNVLLEQVNFDKENMEPALYKHVWEGDFYEQSEAQILASNYKILEFEAPKNTTFYYGLDFGFAKDPNACIRCFIVKNELFIDYEAGGVGIKILDISKILKAEIPLIEKNIIIADSSRPETIQHLKDDGLPYIKGSKKGKGSVEDGISFIKSFKNVYIHPRCVETIKEFDLYSYKIDKISGNILPIPVDAYNHYVDALRYALEDVRLNRKKTDWELLI